MSHSSQRNEEASRDLKESNLDARRDSELTDSNSLYEVAEIDIRQNVITSIDNIDESDEVEPYVIRDARIDYESDPDEEVVRPVEITSAPRRGPGRPRILRTGARGRPKKSFSGPRHVAGVAEVESFHLAEVPFGKAIKSYNADEWYDVIADKVASIIGRWCADLTIRR